VVDAEATAAASEVDPLLVDSIFAGVAGTGVLDVFECDPFNFTFCANGASEALEALDTGEIARSSSSLSAGDFLEDASTSPFDLAGV